MGKIYLIAELNTDPTLYKLGVTKREVTKRLKEHQTGASNELIIINEYETEYHHKIEALLKRDYKTHRTEGGTEWFMLPDDVMSNFTNQCEKAEKMFKLLRDSGNPFI